MAIKKNNFEKLYQKVLDTHEDLMKMFSAREIESINKGEPFVVYAVDSFFSGWGKSKNETNHVLVVCWDHYQKFNVYQGLCEDRNMTFVNTAPLENFLKASHKGTWSVKNANDCPIWNKGLKVEV